MGCSGGNYRLAKHGQGIHFQGAGAIQLNCDRFGKPELHGKSVVCLAATSGREDNIDSGRVRGVFNVTPKVTSLYRLDTMTGPECPSQWMTGCAASVRASKANLF